MEKLLDNMRQEQILRELKYANQLAESTHAPTSDLQYTNQAGYKEYLQQPIPTAYQAYVEDQREHHPYSDIAMAVFGSVFIYLLIKGLFK